MSVKASTHGESTAERELERTSPIAPEERLLAIAPDVRSRATAPDVVQRTIVPDDGRLASVPHERPVAIVPDKRPLASVPDERPVAIGPRERPGEGALAGSRGVSPLGVSRFVIPLRARRHAVVTEVGRALGARCHVAPRSPLLLGVSGGADSVALLVACLILSRRREPPCGALRVLHVHHNLRGRAADEDAAFVLDLCERLGVEAAVENVHPKRLEGNLANRARTLRYRALARSARRFGIAHVAVAHHADDQLETILMALARGAGPAGLGGMAWRRAIPLRTADVPDVSLELIRPLLKVRHRDCIDLCRTAGIEWREDATNLDLDAGGPRARLRRDVIPALEAIWSDIARRAAMSAETLSAAARALDEHLDRVSGPRERNCWPRAALAALSTAEIAAILRRSALCALPSNSDRLDRRRLFAAAERIRETTARPCRLEWPGGLSVEITARVVRLTRADRTEA